MKAGIHYFALPPAFSFAHKLEHAVACGFEGIELTILADGALRLDSTPSEISTLRSQLAAAGLALTDLASTRNWQCSLTSGDANIRALATERLKRQIELAAELGGTAVLAVPGFVGMDHSPVAAGGGEYSPVDEVVDYEDAYHRSVEAFCAIAPFAKERGVQVCIENVWTRFLLSPLEMRRFLEEIGSPWVGAYFDTGNVFPSGYPEHWARILGGKIGRVHLKDYSRATGSFTGLLEGCADFGKVLAELTKAGYDGWLTAEIFADPHNPEQTAALCRQAISTMLGLAES